MNTSIKSPKSMRWWIIIVGLALVLGIISLSLSSRRASSDPNDFMRETVVSGIQDNISKLSSAILVWKSERKGFGPYSNKPASTGNHQLWWNNNKIAISSESNTSIQDPNGQVSSNQETSFTTYDGNKYRVAELPVGSTGRVELAISKEPPSDWCENNYLQRVGWQGLGGLNEVFEATVPGIELWSNEIAEDGTRLIKREFRESKYPLVGFWYYDVAKGCALVSSKQYSEDQLQKQTTVHYEQISGGAWFPVSVITEHYNIQNSELLLRSKMEIDGNKSVFNDSSQIPEDIFQIEVGPNTEVRDFTSLKTRLKMKLNDF